MRRHLVFPMDFDTRANLLDEPGETWEEIPRKLHLENRAMLIEALRNELGPLNFEMKLQNFRDAGHAPFSIIAHHNSLYHQVRFAFIHGYYYPALVGGCGLGERMLNHLLIDLREEFQTTPEYKGVYRKGSFDDWETAITVLETWGVFQAPNVAGELRLLKELRNKSIHFNVETYGTLRHDALAALLHLKSIFDGQFGIVGKQDWRIEGTAGAFFIKKDYENNPFMKKYYLPQCPLVGPHYAVKFTEEEALFYDQAEYEDREITDAKFAELFTTRAPNKVVSTDGPPGKGVAVVARLPR